MKKLERLRIRERYSQIQLEITRDILKYLIYIVETRKNRQKSTLRIPISLFLCSRARFISIPHSTNRHCAFVVFSLTRIYSLYTRCFHSCEPSLGTRVEQNRAKGYVGQSELRRQTRRTNDRYDFHNEGASLRRDRNEESNLRFRRESVRQSEAPASERLILGVFGGLVKSED